MTQPTCEERIDAQLASTVEDIGYLMAAAQGDPVPSVEKLADLGVEVDEDPETTREHAIEVLDEYPLSVEVKTVMVVQLSWGGPSDQFEVEIENGEVVGDPVYRFMDWFDGATRPATDPVVRDFLERLAELATIESDR